MTNHDHTHESHDVAAEFCRVLGIDPSAPRQPVKEIDVATLVRAQRMESFVKLCPPEFLQKIDEAKIPNIAAWRTADEWGGTFPGVWLWSADTGEAKSRMLWRKFGTFHVEQGMTVQRVTGLNLAEAYAEALSRGRTSAFYGHVCGTDVVMLDDLDKMALPEEGQGFNKRDQADTNARFLREMFDAFYEERTRVLVTANRSIAWFGERIGPSCERRMKAVCREIEF